MPQASHHCHRGLRGGLLPSCSTIAAIGSRGANLTDSSDRFDPDGAVADVGTRVAVVLEADRQGGRALRGAGLCYHAARTTVGYLLDLEQVDNE
ncbi:hypothetical protein Ade02nite_09160 [Paractinoplanes deccanensis]|uniref:Uncharacterized protein n=1 Tax=Paractinoplanes deccanensis TaxID=113561 RepID=A0ABQ3XX40_9ACTN|nr:hypothetical protein Ade02nite_09160 [Actinoplanes deccanensis]